jgi:hypothetical protein
MQFAVGIGKGRGHPKAGLQAREIRTNPFDPDNAWNKCNTAINSLHFKWCWQLLAMWTAATRRTTLPNEGKGPTQVREDAAWQRRCAIPLASCQKGVKNYDGRGGEKIHDWGSKVPHSPQPPTVTHPLHLASCKGRLEPMWQCCATRTATRTRHPNSLHP